MSPSTHGLLRGYLQTVADRQNLTLQDGICQVAGHDWIWAGTDSLKDSQKMLLLKKLVFGEHITTTTNFPLDQMKEFRLARDNYKLLLWKRPVDDAEKLPKHLNRVVYLLAALLLKSTVPLQALTDLLRGKVQGRWYFHIKGSKRGMGSPMRSPVIRRSWIRPSRMVCLRWWLICGLWVESVGGYVGVGVIDRSVDIDNCFVCGRIRRAYFLLVRSITMAPFQQNLARTYLAEIAARQNQQLPPGICQVPDHRWVWASTIDNNTTSMSLIRLLIFGDHVSPTINIPRDQLEQLRHARDHHRLILWKILAPGDEEIPKNLERIVYILAGLLIRNRIEPRMCEFRLTRRLKHFGKLTRLTTASGIDYALLLRILARSGSLRPSARRGLRNGSKSKIDADQPLVTFPV